MTEKEIEHKMWENFDLPWLHFGMIKPETPVISYSNAIKRARKSADDMVDGMKAKGQFSTERMERQIAEEAGKTAEERIRMEFTEVFFKIIHNHYLITPD